MPFEVFPYTNFHELNLDWIISEIKKLKDIDISGDNALIFSNVAEMLQYSEPENNMLIITKGYYVENDGGNACYIIRDTVPGEQTDNMFTYILNNGKIAELIHNNVINALALGLHADGATDNSSLMTLINNYDNLTVFFPKGKYLIESPVTFNKHISLIGDCDTFLGLDLLDRTVFIINVTANNIGININANHCLVKNILFYSNSYTASADDSLIDGLTNNWYSSTINTAGVIGLKVANYNNEVSNCTFRGFSGHGCELGINNKGNNLYFEECRIGFRSHNDSIITDLFFKLCENGMVHQGSLTTITNVRLDFIKTCCITLGNPSNSNVIKNVIADTVGERCIEFQANCNDNYVECYGRVGYRYANETASNYASHPDYSCMVYIVSNCVGNTIETSATQKVVNGVTAPFKTIVQTSPDHTHYIVHGYKAINANTDILYTRYGNTPTDSVLTYPYQI